MRPRALQVDRVLSNKTIKITNINFVNQNQIYLKYLDEHGHAVNCLGRIVNCVGHAFNPLGPAVSPLGPAVDRFRIFFLFRLRVVWQQK